MENAANNTCTCVSTAFVWNADGYCACGSLYFFNSTTFACNCDLTKAYLSGTNCTACPNTAIGPDGNGGCLCNGTNVWQGGSCVSCNNIPNYVLLSTGACFLCGTNGTYTVAKIINAANNTCTCTSANLTWNSNGYCGCISSLYIFNATVTSCTCDFSKAYLSGTACTACPTGSTADGKGGCLCSGNKIWQGGLCVSCSAANNYVLLSNNSCFLCGTNGTYTAGKVVSTNNNSCSCTSANLTWNSNGYCTCSNSLFIFNASAISCTCDLTKAYLSGSNCSACPGTTKGPDGKGGCLCNGSAAWQGGSCVSCSSSANVVILSNGSCFVCGTTGTYTSSKVVSASNNTCTCNSTFLIWNFNGYCDCGNSSAMLISGNTFSCFNCMNATAFTIGKASSTSCTCASSNLRWNSITRACDCGNLTNAIITGNGTSLKCFSCLPSTTVIGASADMTACVCVGKLVWNKITSTCGCTNSSLSIVGVGINTQCISCSSIPYGKTNPSSSTDCSCLGTGLIFNTSIISCTCPANSIITSSFACFACPSGSSPMTPYECLCPIGSIWNIASGSCTQCGSSSIPNSLPNGGTNFACICNTGYIWDVMTQSCTSSICTTASTSCMKCPSGSSRTLNASSSKNLIGGATVQALLNGTFTNYNQIKGYQCTCQTGFSWDSLRLRCFTTGLK